MEAVHKIQNDTFKTKNELFFLTNFPVLSFAKFHISKPVEGLGIAKNNHIAIFIDILRYIVIYMYCELSKMLENQG
jgi:hypothetical protein